MADGGQDAKNTQRTLQKDGGQAQRNFLSILFLSVPSTRDVFSFFPAFAGLIFCFSDFIKESQNL